jgi:outer membrane putative beta-barrel porin/alpha-amylase
LGPVCARALRALLAVLSLVALAAPVHAQQRPLLTEDPEPIGSGRILLEGGFDFAHGYHNPVSGLEGDLFTIPTIGISFGLSSIVEFQIDGGLYNHLSVTRRDPGAPLAGLLTFTGDSTHGVSNAVVGTKIRLLAEGSSHPAIALRFATKLPNASNEKGIDLDTTDFSGSVLVAKTVQSVRIVVDAGAGILTNPTGLGQNDVFLYGLSFARAITNAAELVGEANGRFSTRSDGAPPGTETRGQVRLGGRYTHGPLRVDAGVFFGTTSLDPTIGMTAGFTYVFNAFTVP